MHGGTARTLPDPVFRKEFGEGVIITLADRDRVTVDRPRTERLDVENGFRVHVFLPAAHASDRLSDLGDMLLRLRLRL
ncbi:hypothetical protein ACS72_00235 [Acinetobacter sp. VT 511]|nr:hypothetical protein ACS72_00235 [Acinetobacter sp. VT 511]